ncbi:hypothetical protein, variant [Cladophialophora immunda]|uniref:Ubiquitin-like domain-containing protein n=1 Tax=Cladophialophora immunda TaxID=569365 RepID=A0A0D2DFY2_9EURO|nr:hypothetical protein, variant [Cladophialophora immunda]KIW34614.1 hypothetical protein, variant [Cladophialophora immunda]
MASSSPAPPQFPDLPPPDPDHVHLRTAYLVTGNPRPPHYLGSLSLNTTISALKEKIQSELPEHPSPSEQRLIYQGRPLLRNDANLRDILRIPDGVPDTLPHTIHIVIQSQQNTSQSQQPPNPILNPTLNPILNPPPPPPLQVDHQHAEFARTFRAAQTSANRLQESLVRIQQQIEANRADLRSVQQRIALQHTNLGAPPNLMNGQVNTNGQPLPAPHPQTFAMNFHFDLPVDQLAQAQRAPGPGNAHPRHTPHASSGLPPQQPRTAPLGRPQHNIQEFQGPNGERMTLITEQQPAVPSQPQTNTATHAPQNNIPPPVPPTFAFPVNLLPSMSTTPMYLSNSPAQNRPSPPQLSNTTAWLLSSPVGPQGFLFAPGHGWFCSPPVRRQQQVGSVPTPQPQTNDPNGAGATQLAQTNNQGQPNANRAIIRANEPQPDQPQPVPAVAQAQQNGEDNDLFAFIINRGWLFLRLYLFMFVFSEPGTWKRWLMIFAAAVICLQPRDGPLTRLLAAARRHLDNLIGPPPPQPPPEAVAHQQDPVVQQPGGAGQVRAGATAQRPANVRGALTMTPQEARARLEDQRQDHEPRPWRDTLYRVEQSIALFLASLIPGVGERHVRAREEARREEQRRVEERGRAENEAAAERPNGDEADAPASDTQASSAEARKPEVNVDASGEQSTSTSVEVRDGEAESGELRNRT